MSVPAADNLRRWVFTFGYNDDDPPGLAADLLQEIDALHQPITCHDGFAADYVICGECGKDWPCTTARRLHPEEAP